MHLFLIKVLIGGLVGLLVGLTGLGSGMLLLPILVFGLGVPPITAVGSDAIFSALTKVGAGILHWRQGSVNWRLVRALALGSIPSSLGGVLLLAYLRSTHGNGVNDFLRVVIGILLVGIPLLMLFPPSSKVPVTRRMESISSSWVGGALIGLIAGFLVGMSSVGSGTLVLALIVFLTRCSPSVLVGTDIAHAVILTGFTSLLYFRMGNIDLPLVAALLIGSVPGALIGARLTAHLPSLWLQRVLCIGLLITGAKLLWV